MSELFDDKYKLSEDSARDQLDIMLDYYDFDIEDIEDEDQKINVKLSQKKLIKAIRKGYLEIQEIDESLIVIQNLKKSGDSIEYKEVSGRSKVAMKSKSTNDFYGRIYALMGSLSGMGAEAIEKLKGIDLSIAECLGVLFLQI